MGRIDQFFIVNIHQDDAMATPFYDDWEDNDGMDEGDLLAGAVGGLALFPCTHCHIPFSTEKGLQIHITKMHVPVEEMVDPPTNTTKEVTFL